MASLRELLDQAKKEKEAKASATVGKAAEGALVPPNKPPTITAAAAPAIPPKPVPPTNGTVFSRIQPKRAVDVKVEQPAIKSANNGGDNALANNGQARASVETSSSVKLPATEVPASPVQKPGDEKTWQELRNNLDFLANNIEQKELVGQAVRNVGKMLAQNPQFESKMVRADFNLIVRGLRSAFNVAARKKVERQETKQASSAEVNELMQMAKDLGISMS